MLVADLVMGHIDLREHHLGRPEVGTAEFGTGAFQRKQFLVDDLLQVFLDLRIDFIHGGSLHMARFVGSGLAGYNERRAPEAYDIKIHPRAQEEGFSFKAGTGGGILHHIQVRKHRIGPVDNPVGAVPIIPDEGITGEDGAVIELLDLLGVLCRGGVDPHTDIVGAEFRHGPFVIGYIVKCVVSTYDKVFDALGILYVGVGRHFGNGIAVQVTGDGQKCRGREYDCLFHNRQNLMSKPKVTVEVSGKPPLW